MLINCDSKYMKKNSDNLLMCVVFRIYVLYKRVSLFLFSYVMSLIFFFQSLAKLMNEIFLSEIKIHCSTVWKHSQKYVWISFEKRVQTAGNICIEIRIYFTNRILRVDDKAIVHIKYWKHCLFKFSSMNLNS